jgi:hypothetical protein
VREAVGRLLGSGLSLDRLRQYTALDQDTGGVFAFPVCLLVYLDASLAEDAERLAELMREPGIGGTVPAAMGLGVSLDEEEHLSMVQLVGRAEIGEVDNRHVVDRPLWVTDELGSVLSNV